MRRFGLLVFIVVCIRSLCMCLDMMLISFGGVDVGGGSVANATRHSLARISLRWMIRQCFILKTGLLFHKNRFKSIGLDPRHVLPTRPPSPPLSATHP